MQCLGWRFGTDHRLYSVGKRGQVFGSVHPQYCFDLHYAHKYTDCRTLADFRRKYLTKFKELQHACVQLQGQGLYFGDSDCVGSVFCQGFGVTNSVCKASSLLCKKASLRKRQKVGPSPGSKTRNTFLTFSEIGSAKRKQMQTAKSANRRTTRAARRTEILERRMAKMVKCSEHWDDLPAFFHNLRKAYRSGVLQKHPKLVDVLQGISQCLKNGTRKGRTLSKTEKQFYALLLNAGGAWAHEFVSKIFLGPDLRTTKSNRFSIAQLSAADLEFTPDCFRKLKELLVLSGLHNAPGIIAEDTTTVHRRLDWERCTTMVNNALRHGIKVYRFSGPPITIYSVQELRDHFNKAGTTMASYAYLYLWIPIVNNAPWFRLCVIATDNKFNAGWVWDMWRKFHGAAKKEGLHLCGHCSDGDARLRKTDFRMNVEDNSSIFPESWRLAHRMLLLRIPKTVEGLYVLGFQDWMHLLWRLRLQLLDPKRVLTLGAGRRAARAYLVDAPHLLTGDLDPGDKQNWGAVERIFSVTTLKYLVGRGDNTFFSGTFAYIMLGMRLKDAWLADTQREGPRQCVKDASFVHGFILFWRWWMATSTRGETLCFTVCLLCFCLLVQSASMVPAYFL